MQQSAMIAFKHFETMVQMAQMNPKVIAVLQWMGHKVWPDFGQQIMLVTAGWYLGGSGVHAAYRAVDVSARENGTGKLVGFDVASAMSTLINRAWDHGSGGKFNVCYYHIAQHGDDREWHFHVQVRDATALKVSDVVVG